MPCSPPLQRVSAFVLVLVFLPKAQAGRDATRSTRLLSPAERVRSLRISACASLGILKFVVGVPGPGLLWSTAFCLLTGTAVVVQAKEGEQRECRVVAGASDRGDCYRRLHNRESRRADLNARVGRVWLGFWLVIALSRSASRLHFRAPQVKLFSSAR